jgi:putative ABC transport system permease protein
VRLGGWTALALRESRGSSGRLAFFAVCLSVGVAAVVSVAALSRALDDGIKAQARQLLAADVSIESRRPIPAGVLAAADALAGAKRSETRELPSVVSVPTAPGEAPGPSVLCELKAVGPGYPFYGTLEIDPVRPLDELLGPDRVLVGAELLRRLAVAPGDSLRIGEATFTIAGTLLAEPDRLAVSFTLGPRILLGLDGLARTGLLGVGSRVQYRALVALGPDASPDAVRDAAETIQEAMEDPAFVEVETYLEAQPALRQGLDRVDRFLALVALLSLLVGGIGVAQAVRAWLAGRLDAVATLRALGVRPREAFLLYLGQTLALGLAGSVFGALAGALVAQAVPRLLAGLLPVRVEVGWPLLAIAKGLALGLAVATLFALRPLLEVLRVPPVLVLRREAERLPASRPAVLVVSSCLVIGIAMTAAVQARSLVEGLLFTGGLLLAASALALAAWGAMRLVARAPRDLGSVALRHGLAALARPDAGTLGAVVALGLGVLLVLGMYLVQQRLSAQLDTEIPTEAPTVFLIDIQSSQWDGVRRALEHAEAADVDFADVVVGRLAEVDGVPVDDLVPLVAASEEARERRWVLTREQRMTPMERLPPDNVVVAGALWSDPDRAEISIERDFAADLGVKVGDTLTMDVQGVPIELLVSSLRTVEWERFSINFFLVVEPAALEGAPRFRVASARLPSEREGPFVDSLAAEFPNVTVLRLREVLERVVAVLDQVGRGVRLLGAFTVLAGIAILAGAISASAVRRARQVALYKTLGMTRRQIVAAFAVEYALVGLLAGLIGTLGGVLLAWAVTRFGFEIPWGFSPFVYGAAVLVTSLLAVVAGLAASARALAVRPLAVLRQAE